MWIEKQEHSEKLLTEEDLTFKKAMELAQGYESSEKLKGADVTVHKVSPHTQQ